MAIKKKRHWLFTLNTSPLWEEKEKIWCRAHRLNVGTKSSNRWRNPITYCREISHTRWQRS
jgi:hypothetical protein